MSNESPPLPEQLLTVQAAARRCGLNAKTLRDAIHRGELRAYAFGSWWRVRVLDLEAWLEAHRYVPPCERHRGTEV